jgi:hypothetical protein
LLCDRGLIFSKGDIDNYISHLHLNAKDMFYQPCGSLEIITRVLRNLTVSFEKLGDHQKVNEIKILINSIADGSTNEVDLI